MPRWLVPVGRLTLRSDFFILLSGSKFGRQSSHQRLPSGQVVKWSSGQVVKGPKGQKKSPNPEIALQVEAWRKVDNVKALRFHLYRQARIIQTTQ